MKPRGNGGGKTTADTLMLGSRRLVRRVVLRYQRKYGDRMAPDDIASIARLRLLEVAQIFRFMPDRQSFEAYGWKAMCGAIETAARVEIEQAKLMRLSCSEVPTHEVALGSDEAADADDDEPMAAFLDRLAVAAMLGLLSEESVRAAVVPEDHLNRALQRALERLTPRVRHVVLMRVVEQQTTLETANALGISVATVKRELRAGLGLLARMLAAERTA